MSMKLMDPASIVLVTTTILLSSLSSLNNVKRLRPIKGIGLPPDPTIYRGLAWTLKRCSRLAFFFYPDTASKRDPGSPGKIRDLFLMVLALKNDPSVS